MKKFYFIIAIVALIGAFVLYVSLQLDSIVEGLIEDYGSAATQTPVQVAGVAIDLSAASGTISNLTVGNPEGFSGNAVEMENFSLTLDPTSLATDTIVIRELMVRGARLNILQQANGNNLREISRNLGKQQSSDSGDDQAAGKKLIIDRFTLEGASASLSAPDFDEVREVTLPTVTVRDIGRASNGATGAEVAEQVLRPVINQALESAAVQALKDKASDQLEEVTDKVLEGIFGSDKEPE